MTPQGLQKAPWRSRLACVVVTTALALSWLYGAPASAQEVPDVQLPEPVLLQQGRPAPFTGQLMHQADVLRWADEIEDLTAQIERNERWAEERCGVRVQAVEERLQLRETLYQQRIEELAREVAERRREAEAEWYEHPALWFSVGVLVTTVAVIGVAVASQ